MKVKLGERYRDKVTGFEGQCVGVFHWMTGCDTCSLQPETVDGKWVDSVNFDVVRLEKVKSKPVKLETKKNPGGPHDSPLQHGHK